MADKNFYDILELSEEERNLSGDEFDKVLKKKWRKLSASWHPDRFSTKTEEERLNAEEKFKEISEAYNTLSDPQKRQQYDFSQNGGFNGGFDPFGGGFDPFDMFERRAQQQRTYKGKDVQIEIDVTLEEAYYGSKKEFYYDRVVSCGRCNGTGSADGKNSTCPHCNGSGMVTEVKRQGNIQMMSSRPCSHCHGTGKKITNPCPHCHGEGMVKENTKETIEIPKGVISGAYTTISGKGCGLPKNMNGIDGDLVIVFNVVDDVNFKCKNDGNLYSTLNINIFDALLGCEKEITCIDKSKVKITLPEITKQGHVFIIKGKGMPKFNNNSQYGDLIVTVNYIYPEKLTNKHRELFKKIIKG